MIELALLALMHLGSAPMIAVRSVAADAAELDTYLRDPAHERRLLAAAVDVRPSKSTGLVSVRLRDGRGELWMTWILTPGRGTTEVTLVAQAEPRGPLAELALLLGGRRRLARRLDAALATLATTCAHHVEELVPAQALGVRRAAPARGGEPVDRRRRADRDVALGELLPAALRDR
jgi:hypothetical protein